MLEDVAGVLFIAAIVSGTACHWLAVEKGYSGCSAFLVGFFFSLLGLIAYAGLPDKKSQELLKEINRMLVISPAAAVRCPNCGNLAQPGSRYCPKCGTQLSRQEQQEAHK